MVEILMEMVFGVLCVFVGGFWGVFCFLNTRRFQTFSCGRIWEEVV